VRTTAGGSTGSVRNLRIREDIAKYLLNLDVNSAYYDPKSRYDTLPSRQGLGGFFGPPNADLGTWWSPSVEVPRLLCQGGVLHNWLSLQVKSC
jgi:hypothetical protein